MELTTNLNQITRRVTDCAGNTSTTNIAVTLDYSRGVSVVVFCYDAKDTPKAAEAVVLKQDGMGRVQTPAVGCKRRKVSFPRPAP